jgi:hypothetical protein
MSAGRWGRENGAIFRDAQSKCGENAGKKERERGGETEREREREREGEGDREREALTVPVYRCG